MPWRSTPTRNVFVGTQDMSGGRLYRSEDGGRLTALSAQSIHEVAASPYNTRYRGGGAGCAGLLRSRDQGDRGSRP